MTEGWQIAIFTTSSAVIGIGMRFFHKAVVDQITRRTVKIVLEKAKAEIIDELIDLKKDQAVIRRDVARSEAESVGNRERGQQMAELVLDVIADKDLTNKFRGRFREINHAVDQKKEHAEIEYQRKIELLEEEKTKNKNGGSEES